MGKRIKKTKTKQRIVGSVEENRTSKKYISSGVFWSVSTLLLVAYIVSGVLYAKGICNSFIPTGMIYLGTMILFALSINRLDLDKEDRIFWPLFIMLFMFLTSFGFAASNHDSSQNTTPKDYNRGLIEGILIGSSLK